MKIYLKEKITTNTYDGVEDSFENFGENLKINYKSITKLYTDYSL